MAGALDVVAAWRWAAFRLVTTYLRNATSLNILFMPIWICGTIMDEETFIVTAKYKGSPKHYRNWPKSRWVDAIDEFCAKAKMVEQLPPKAKRRLTFLAAEPFDPIPF